jgi:hypothetical protein
MYNIPTTPEQQYYYDIRIQQIMHEHHVNVKEATHLLGRRLYPEPHQLALWESFVNAQGARREAMWRQQQVEVAACKEQARMQHYGTGKHSLCIQSRQI